ncbi:arabinogalactan endo-1,4-beta-galactosidase [Streptomyces agglomeratus]|uniref:Arabinogalactan endo-beta-1,4-galactanase n=1 Tax=Streptomyces agglomeratus TaxID=285458 RepID=A0A1E5P2M3_9ACTN|nr:glycosyl hydrolase 53 family protein [Streptomyces agglomeratus]OEJ23790.1 arabinogalactan endo-1,4-beta-galactosidase [Streptomyces agglomeratus]OEJ54696.1 arabinogalactan endo-1,4-beta-galactosidase [Streptomyces agglomeratus]OEJ62067.1 arabinogalactan endo-1,4-beta-galactosidase [Streptomyces agglomeratus]
MHAPPRGTFRTLLRAAALPVLGALLVTALPGQQAHAASTLTNPGFESGTSGWSTYSATGQESAAYAEAGGHGGSSRLAHWSSTAYKAETYQYLSGLTNGNYRLSAWVRSSGGQNSAYLALRNCGSPEQRTDLPPTPNGQWIRLVTSVRVTGGQCTVSINSDAKAGNWLNVDDLTFTPGTTGLPVKGVDVSTLRKSEDLGGVYRTSGGTPGDGLAILKSAGANYGRLKVWVNPADGYNNKARVLEAAKRIKGQGMKLLVDFHYSDTWADPGAQTKPAAWASHSYSRLTTDVYDHTYDVLSALKAQGTTADMVQIGNEINTGLLWPEGSTDDWSRTAGLLKSGISAAKAVSSSTQTALHLAHGGDNSLYRWWFDNATAQGVNFDVIALSFYGYWHGPLSGLQANLDDISARYGKPVMVAETAYAFRLDSDDSHENIIDTTGELISGYPASPAGQAAWLRDVMNVVEAVPNGRGLGVVYWEPTWTAVPGNGWDPADPSSGNGWENQALFGYDDRLLPAANWFGHR